MPPTQSYDFTLPLNIPGDLFQPEEIFQLDQPIKNEFTNVVPNVNTTSQSPPTLLDLGSGTIHREYKAEYWTQTNVNTNDDSNSSSRFNFNASPDTIMSNNNNTLCSSSFDAKTHQEEFFYQQQINTQNQVGFVADLGEGKMYYDDLHYEYGNKYKLCQYEQGQRFPSAGAHAPSQNNEYIDYTCLLSSNGYEKMQMADGMFEDVHNLNGFKMAHGYNCNNEFEHIMLNN